MAAWMVAIRAATGHAKKPHRVVWTRLEVVSAVFDIVSNDGKEDA